MKVKFLVFLAAGMTVITLAGWATADVFTDLSSWNTAVSNEGLLPYVSTDGFDDLNPDLADTNQLVRSDFTITRGVGEDDINVSDGTFISPQSSPNYLMFSDDIGGDGSGEILIQFNTFQTAISFYLGELHDTPATSADTSIEVSSDGSVFSEVWKISGTVGSNNSGTLQELYSSEMLSVGDGVYTFVGLTDFSEGIKVIRITNTTNGGQDRIALDTIASVPEPASVALLGIVSGLGFFIRRRFLA